MSTPHFSRPGAVDLSALSKPQRAPSSAGGSAGGGSFEVEITGEESLRTEVVNRSMSVVVLLSVWADDVPESVQINDTLSLLADEFGGRFVLATLDARAHARLVSALGIPGVPLVVAALRGQLAPLIQDPLPEAEMRKLVQEILQAAVAGGVSGTAEPVRRPADATDGAEQEPPARFPEAEDALLRGDFDEAITGYQTALKSAPNDMEAVTGLARAQLLKRALGADEPAARRAAAANPADVDANLLVADLDLAAGRVQEAFDGLLALIRRTSEADRDRARRHLLELFAVVGDEDARVTKARRALTAALF